MPGIPEGVPIYFPSHRLSETQQRWPVIGKEVFAILYAVQKLDYYLSQAVFTIKTNHKPLKHLLEVKWMNKKIQQWALKLSSYQCKIEYLVGRDNTCVDLLSRILEKLESKFIRLEPGVDDRAYRVNAINSHTLSKHSVWETEDEEEVIRDPHWEAIIERKQEDSKISSLRSKIKAGTVPEDQCFVL